MAVMQSQQAWHIISHCLSPLVQVMTQPMSVISQVHVHMVMLQQQTIWPFIIMQQPIMPPAFIIIICCSIMAAVLSSQTQVMFMPPGHLLMVIVQRGSIMPPVGDIIMPGVIAGIVGIDWPGIMPICIIRSLVIIGFIEAPGYSAFRNGTRPCERANIEIWTVVPQERMRRVSSRLGA